MHVSKTQRQWLRTFAVVLVLGVLLTGCRRAGTTTGTGTGLDEPATVTIWRTFDSDEVFQPLIDDFERENPRINIEYRQLPFDEYELVTSEALAAGEGPDIWSIRNDWLPRHQNKLVAMPEGLLRSGPDDTRTDSDILGQLFAPTVSTDLIRDGRIYGLPFYVDTLAIFRNDTLFEEKIGELRQANRNDDADFLRENFNTYDKLQRAVQILTERDGENIQVSGLAAGTANNIDRAEDIVYAMMLQNGTEMLTPNVSGASFQLPTRNAVGETVNLGTEALTRFTSFADPSKPFYSWNASMPSSIDAFIEGRAAMIFGYQYYNRIFTQRAPTLRYSEQSFPQVRDTDTPIDYASYYVETVTKNADDPTLVWRVLNDLVITNGANYRGATQRPDPAPIQQIPTTVDRAQTGAPFQFQQQTAVTWFKTLRPDKVDTIFREMIQQVGTRSQPAQNAVEAAAQRVSAILQNGR